MDSVTFAFAWPRRLALVGIGTPLLNTLGDLQMIDLELKRLLTNDSQEKAPTLRELQAFANSLKRLVA
jgi:hypothetical protein